MVSQTARFNSVLPYKQVVNYSEITKSVTYEIMIYFAKNMRSKDQLVDLLGKCCLKLDSLMGKIKAEIHVLKHLPIYLSIVLMMKNFNQEHKQNICGLDQIYMNSYILSF